MAGIPVNDLGPMIGMPYAGSSGQTAPPKSAAESFESVWNGQV